MKFPYITFQDNIRTGYYRDCIMSNAELFKDAVVLDVGCGTGILSMMAARAGAKQVIGVDMSDVVYQAMDIVKENDLQGVVTILRGRMEDVNLPVQKVGNATCKQILLIVGRHHTQGPHGGRQPASAKGGQCYM
jgi:ribosomal protein L11 methylase PrmA